MKKTITLCFAIFTAAALPFAQATPPDLVNFQGVLRDASDAPLDGAHDMVFRFFDDPAAGEEILVDSHLAAGSGAVTVTGGLFNVSLGGGTVTDGSGPGTYTTLTDMFGDYSDVWVEVQVGGDPEMTPRIRVVSAAYALNAGTAASSGDADTLDGLDSLQFLRKDVDDTAAGVITFTATTTDVQGSLVDTVDSETDVGNSLHVESGTLGVGVAPDANYGVYSSGSKYGGYFSGTEYGSHSVVDSDANAWVRGVSAYARNTGTGAGTSVYGMRSDAEAVAAGNDITVFGLRSAATGAADSTGQHYGVFGAASGGEGNHYALYGSANEGSGTGTHYGVYGSAVGGATNYGGYFYGSDYGVYGNAGAGWGLYTNDDAYVGGMLDFGAGVDDDLTAADVTELTDGGDTTLHSHAGGGDADTLDTLDSLQFLRSDVADTAAGVITFTAATTDVRGSLVDGDSLDTTVNVGEDLHVEGGNVGVGVAPDSDYAVYGAGSSYGGYFTGSSYGSYSNGSDVASSGFLYGGYGLGNATGAANNLSVYGLYGKADGDASSTGLHYGVYGEAKAATGIGTHFGVLGTADGGAENIGVYGTGDSVGGYFYGSSGDASGDIIGTRTTGSANGAGNDLDVYGVRSWASGDSTSTGDHYGLWAIASSVTADGLHTGVYGRASGSAINRGVYGEAFGGTTTYGGVFNSASSEASGTLYGAYATATASGASNSATIYGLRTQANADPTSTGDHYGVYGEAIGGDGDHYGLYGIANAFVSAGTHYGVYGTASGGTTNWGLYTPNDAYVGGTLYFGAGAHEDLTALDVSELTDGQVTTRHTHFEGNAKTLDGLDSLQFLRSDVDDTAAGDIRFLQSIGVGVFPMSWWRVDTTYGTGLSAGYGAVRGEGANGPTNGYLGVVGDDNFDGVSTADWLWQEIGVAGISTGAGATDNVGVLGHSNFMGVRGEAIDSAASGELNGVYGYGDATGSSNDITVYGLRGEAMGIVTGTGDHYGVYGIASDTTIGGTHYGVYGKAWGSPTNYGGYFTGEDYGVYGTSPNWGLYTPDDAYVGGMLDFGGDVNDDLTAADVTDLTDGGDTTLHTHSGVDADLLDGLDSTDFAALGHTHMLTSGATDVVSTAAEVNKLSGTGATVTAANLTGLTDGSNADALHAHSGLGGDADTLDTLDSLQFLRSDVDDTAAGAITFSDTPSGTGVGGGGVYVNPATVTSDYTLLGVAVGGVEQFRIDAEGDVNVAGILDLGGGADDDLTAADVTELTDGGDTTLHTHSGVDADLLDGLDSTDFAALGHTHTLTSGATDVAATAAELDRLSGVGPTVTAANLTGLTDGSNADALHAHSGLGGDADTLDLLDSLQFLRSDVDDTAAGVVTFTAATTDVQGSLVDTVDSVVNVGNDLTVAGTVDLGAGADDDLTAADVTALTDGGTTTLHAHPGGGSDADTLDLLDSLQFLRSDVDDTAAGTITFSDTPSGTSVGDGGVYVNPATATADYTLLGVAVGGVERFRIDAEGDVDVAGILDLGAGADDDLTAADVTALTDGGTTTLHAHPGGGSDADTLDLLDSLQFLRSDVDDTAAGVVTFTAATTDVQGSLVDTVGAVVDVGDDLYVQGGNVGVGAAPDSKSAVYGVGSIRGGNFIGSESGVLGNSDGTFAGPHYGGLFSTSGDTGTGTHYGVNGNAMGTATTNYGVYGTASGATTNWGLYTPNDAYVGGMLDLGAGADDDLTAADATALTDGGTTTLHTHPGGGSDADTLDTLDSLQFLRSDVDDTAEGVVTFTAATTDVQGSLVDTVDSVVNIGNNLTVAGTVDLGAGADDDLTAADVTDLTDGSDTTLHGHAHTHLLTEGATDVVSTAAEVNKLSGTGATVTAANLTGLTDGSNADALHAHSGLGGDADTLDTLDSLQFLRSDVDDTAAGVITFTAATTDVQGSLVDTVDSETDVGNSLHVESGTVGVGVAPDANYGVYSSSTAYGAYHQGTEYGAYNTVNENSSLVLYGSYNYARNSDTSNSANVYGTFSRVWVAGAANTHPAYGLRAEAIGAGTGTHYGVFGMASGGDGTHYGLYGSATQSSAGTHYGVYGNAGGGDGDHYGVRGQANAASAAGTHYGVYGYAWNGVTSYGGHFTGGDYGVYGTSSAWGVYTPDDAYVGGMLDLGGGTDDDLMAADVTDLTDGGETTLHTHPGGGGDADTLDTLDSLQFLRSDVDDTAAGAIEFSKTIGVGVAPDANYGVYSSGTVYGAYHQGTEYGAYSNVDEDTTSSIYGSYSTARNLDATNSANIYGVYAKADAAGASNAHPIFGVNATATGDATSTGPHYGIYASAAGGDGPHYGVRGAAIDAASPGTHYGVFGHAQNGATGYGVYGTALSSTGTTYGVYGKASGGSVNWGLYTPNAAHVGEDFEVDGNTTLGDAASDTVTFNAVVSGGIDFGAGADDDLQDTDVTELTGGGDTTLHSHAGSSDADTLDALDSLQFLRSDVDDTAAGVITFTAATTDVRGSLVDTVDSETDVGNSLHVESGTVGVGVAPDANYGVYSSGTVYGAYHQGTEYGAYNYVSENSPSVLYGAYNYVLDWDATNSAKAYGTYSKVWVAGASNTHPAYGLYGESTGDAASTGSHYGVYGQAYGGNGAHYGLFGSAAQSSSTGTHYGVFGTAGGGGADGDHHGVRGQALSSAAGTHYGVSGQAMGGATNYGGHFYGIDNVASSSGDLYGAYGEGYAMGSDNDMTVYGFRGEALGDATSTGIHYGVYGTASGGGGDHYGLYGLADQPSAGTHYGVYGTAWGGATDYGGYFSAADYGVYGASSLGWGLYTPDDAYVGGMLDFGAGTDDDLVAADVTELTDGGETTLHTHPGGGSDADTLDTLDSLQFLRSDVDDTAAGVVTFTAATTDVQGSLVDTVDSETDVGNSLHVESGTIGVGIAPDSNYGIYSFGSSRGGNFSGTDYGVSGFGSQYGGYFYGAEYGSRSSASSSADVTLYGADISAWNSGAVAGEFVYGIKNEAEASAAGNSLTVWGLRSEAKGAADSTGSRYGVHGLARGGTGTHYGVRGEATQSSGSGNHYGVHGSASGGATNYGGFFYGISGEASASGSMYGANAWASADGADNSMTLYGLRGRAGGASTSTGTHYGVYGTAHGGNGTHYGLYGVADEAATAGTHYGVYGTASGGSVNWGLYTPDNAYVGGDFEVDGNTTLGDAATDTVTFNAVVSGGIDLGGGTDDDLTDTDVTDLTDGGETTLHTHPVGSGDADTLDTLDSLQFLRSDVDDTAAGVITFTAATTDVQGSLVDTVDSVVDVGDDLYVQGGNIGVGVAPNSNYGVYSSGSSRGGYFSGTDYGVYGYGSEYGGYFSGSEYGFRSSASSSADMTVYGAYISGSNSGAVAGASVYGIRNQATASAAGNNLAVMGIRSEAKGAADSTGTHYGVYGIANGGNGSHYGVRGSADQASSTGAHYGIYGYASGGASNYGGSFTATSSNVSGTMHGAYATGTALGASNSMTVYGLRGGASATSTSTGTHYGVYGRASGGDGNHYGLYGLADESATTGTHYGIYGSATGGTTNWGLYTPNDAYVGGSKLEVADNLTLNVLGDPATMTIAGTNLDLYLGGSDADQVFAYQLFPAEAGLSDIGDATDHFDDIYADDLWYDVSLNLFDTYPDLDLIDGMKGVMMRNEETGEMELRVDPATVPSIIRGTPTKDNPAADRFIDAGKADSLLFGAVRELRREGKGREAALRDELNLRTPDRKTGRQEMDGNLQIALDQDANESARLSVFRDGADGLQEEVFRVDEEGNVHARGSFRPASLDLAEYHPVGEAVEAGDVLVMDEQSTDSLRRCSEEADPLVVGIVSAAPGVELGRSLQRVADLDLELAARIDDARAIGDKEAEDEAWAQLEEIFKATHAAVALSGTVACKVDAGYGAINKGDLLVASPTPGHAMKAYSPVPGTILGKAMGALDAGTGTVKVLVMLR